MNQIADLFFTFSRIGAFTFGGGYAMISLLEYECVKKKNWLTSDELMEIVILAEATPGSIAINCATYTGYKIRGIYGAFSATAGIAFPSFLILFVISNFFEHILTVTFISNAFQGIRIGVSVLIIQVGIKMIHNMIKNSSDKKKQLSVSIFFFAVIMLLNIYSLPISTVYLILCSGVTGFFLFGSFGKKHNRREAP